MATALKVFNKFFSSFLKDIRTYSDDLKTLVKAEYKIIDKSSSEYYDLFAEQFLVDDFKKCELGPQLVARGIPISVVLEKSGEANQQKVLCSFYTLLLFAYLHRENNEELTAKATSMYGHIQNNRIDKYEQEKEQIIDEDLCELFDLVIKNTEVTTDPLENSKLAGLAKEISKDIDVGALGDVKPEDMLKSLFGGGGNNMLGDIVQKVSSSLNSKISSGELKHEELLGEAMSMMKLFGGGNNPLFSGLAKSNAGRKHSTRDRLKKRLEERKSQL